MQISCFATTVIIINGLSARIVLSGANCLLMRFCLSDGPVPIISGILKGDMEFFHLFNKSVTNNVHSHVYLTSWHSSCLQLLIASKYGLVN